MLQHVHKFQNCPLLAQGKKFTGSVDDATQGFPHSAYYCIPLCLKLISPMHVNSEISTQLSLTFL
jgi:hypothetical protein